MEEVLKKFDDALKCEICYETTKLPFTTGSCCHFFCQECLLGLVQSICPKCCVPFYPGDIKPDTTTGNILLEINKIAKILKSAKIPSNSLLDEVLHDIEHGENTSNDRHVKITEKDNKKCSIYTKNSNTSEESNETQSLDIIGNSQSPIKKRPLCFPKRKMRHDLNDVKSANEANALSENNVVGKTNKVSPNKSSDSDVDFDGFPKAVVYVKNWTSLEDDSSTLKNLTSSRMKRKSSLNGVNDDVKVENRPTDNKRERKKMKRDFLSEINGNNEEELDDSWVPINSTPQNMNNDRLKRIKKKSIFDETADVKEIDENSFKKTFKKGTDVSNDYSLNNSSTYTKLKRNSLPGRPNFNSSVLNESVNSSKLVRRNYNKQQKTASTSENDSSDIIPGTPQDSAIGLMVEPVSTRGKKQVASLNVNSTKRRDSVKRNSKGETPLLAACAKGNLEEVEKLISEGSDPNIKDYAGWTPMHEAVLKGNIQIVEALVKAGANINTPGHLNITPLLEAVLQENYSIVSFLLRNGADRSLRSRYNYRPLDVAKSEEMIKLLNQVHQPVGMTTKEASTNFSMPDPFCLCPITLNAEQCQILRDFCIKFDLKCVQSLRPDVTHAIVVTQETNVCKSNVNILKCLANGTAVISFNWIEYSMKSNVMTKPDVWEVHGTEEFPNSEAFMKSRINAQKQLPKLLDGLHVSFNQKDWKDWKDMKKSEILNIVQEAGAVVLNREPHPESIPADEMTVMFHAMSDGPMGMCSHVSLYVPGAKEPILKYNMKHLKTLSVKWIVDCIQSFKIIDPL